MASSARALPSASPRAVAQQIGGDLENIARMKSAVGRRPAEHAAECFLGQVLRLGMVLRAFQEERHQRRPPPAIMVRQHFLSVRQQGIALPLRFCFRKGNTRDKVERTADAAIDHFFWT